MGRCQPMLDAPVDAPSDGFEADACAPGEPGCGCPGGRQPVDRFNSPTLGRCYASAGTGACSGYTIERANDFYVYPMARAGLSPLYRCRWLAGRFLLTRDVACEGQGAGAMDGIVGYVADDSSCGNTVLYRVYKPALGDHLYTTQSSERDSAISMGYSAEASPGYVWLTTN